MSNKYKHGDKVPNDVLANRLKELSEEITKGNLNQFVMRVPAELDYCPDLVMSAAARRLKGIEAKDKLIAEWERKYNELSDYTNQIKADGIVEAIQNTPAEYSTGKAIQRCEDLYDYAKKLRNE